jgi:hypothetical protein
LRQDRSRSAAADPSSASPSAPVSSQRVGGRLPDCSTKSSGATVTSQVEGVSPAQAPAGCASWTTPAGLWRLPCPGRPVLITPLWTWPWPRFPWRGDPGAHGHHRMHLRVPHPHQDPVRPGHRDPVLGRCTDRRAGTGGDHKAVSIRVVPRGSRPTGRYATAPKSPS